MLRMTKSAGESSGTRSMPYETDNAAMTVAAVSIR